MILPLTCQKKSGFVMPLELFLNLCSLEWFKPKLWFQDYHKHKKSYREEALWFSVMNIWKLHRILIYDLWISRLLVNSLLDRAQEVWICKVFCFVWHMLKFITFSSLLKDIERKTSVTLLHQFHKKTVFWNIILNFLVQFFHWWSSNSSSNSQISFI